MRPVAIPLVAPAPFDCWQCGACCRRPGSVRLTEADTGAAAAHLGLSPEAFAARYTELRPDRRGLILRERADGACILLSPEGDCAIHAAKPQQCRDFPLGWNYPGWEGHCENQCEWPRVARPEYRRTTRH